MSYWILEDGGWCMRWTALHSLCQPGDKLHTQHTTVAWKYYLLVQKAKLMCWKIHFNFNASPAYIIQYLVFISYYIIIIIIIIIPFIIQILCCTILHHVIFDIMLYCILYYVILYIMLLYYHYYYYCTLYYILYLILHYVNMLTVLPHHNINIL